MEALLQSEAFQPLLSQRPRDRVVVALRATMDEVRTAPAGARGGDVSSPSWWARRAAAWLDDADVPSLRPVLNATGVVLHTNLGRAPLAPAAREAMARAAQGYANLEFDMDTGR